VVKAPARLDWDKLGFINNHYIRAADDTRLLGMVKDLHAGRGEIVHADAEPALARVIPLVKDGAKTLLELADLTVFVLKARPLTLDERTMGLLTEETRARLSRLRDHLVSEVDWSHEPLAAALRAFAEAEGVGMGKFGPALRGVLSGGSPAPDLASALSALGAENSLGRIDDALSQLR
jgi:glutamyl-tRNA synthetase